MGKRSGALIPMQNSYRETYLKGLNIWFFDGVVRRANIWRAWRTWRDQRHHALYFAKVHRRLTTVAKQTSSHGPAAADSATNFPP